MTTVDRLMPYRFWVSKPGDRAPEYSNLTKLPYLVDSYQSDSLAQYLIKVTQPYI